MLVISIYMNWYYDARYTAPSAEDIIVGTGYLADVAFLFLLVPFLDALKDIHLINSWSSEKNMWASSCLLLGHMLQNLVLFVYDGLLAGLQIFSLPANGSSIPSQPANDTCPWPSWDPTTSTIRCPTDAIYLLLLAVAVSFRYSVMKFFLFKFMEKKHKLYYLQKTK
jgi:hypothetical protein